MLGSGLLFVVVVVELEWFIMLQVVSVVMDVVVEEGFGLGVMASERKLSNKVMSCGCLELVARSVVFEKLVSEVIVNLDPESEALDESSAGSGEKMGSGETSLEDKLELLDEKAVLCADPLERCKGSTSSSSSSRTLSFSLLLSVVEAVWNILGRIFLARVLWGECTGDSSSASFDETPSLHWISTSVLCGRRIDNSIMDKFLFLFSTSKMSSSLDHDDLEGFVE